MLQEVLRGHQVARSLVQWERPCTQALFMGTWQPPALTRSVSWGRPLLGGMIPEDFPEEVTFLLAESFNRWSPTTGTQSPSG